jgi:cytochrome c
MRAPAPKPAANVLQGPRAFQCRADSNPQKLAAVLAAIPLALALFAFPRSVQARIEQSGDSERGKALFEKRCTGCHSLDQDKEGPRLRGVYGRTSGTIASFAYSDALKRAHIVWDDAALDKWLSDTDQLIPGNDMAFHVPKPEERADIIRFLRSMSEK